jgi:transcriptional regulator with XRE-family HTH domain
MHSWQSARQAAAFAAAERTGLTKSDIARIAGVHRSQVSRWVSGEQRPSYDRAMRLAAYLRQGHADLADELVAAAGYDGSAEQGPDSAVPAEVLAVIRKNYPPDQQREAIEMLERLSGPHGTEPSRAGDPGSRRAG